MTTDELPRDFVVDLIAGFLSRLPLKEDRQRWRAYAENHIQNRLSEWKGQSNDHE